MCELEGLVAGWCERMAARGSFSREDLDELELHLRSEIELLADQGLSPEEGFLVAARRLGAPEALGEEYAKVHSWATWRAPVYWMATGVLLFLAAQLGASLASALSLQVGGRARLPDGALIALFAGLYVGVPVAAISALAWLFRRRPAGSLAARRLPLALLGVIGAAFTGMYLFLPIRIEGPPERFPPAAVVMAMHIGSTSLLLAVLGAAVVRLRRFAARV